MCESKRVSPAGNAPNRVRASTREGKFKVVVNGVLKVVVNGVLKVSRGHTTLRKLSVGRLLSEK